MTTLDDASVNELLSELGLRIGELGLLDHPQGAHVQLLDVATQDVPCLKPSVLRINGTDVGLIKRDGISISAGSPEFPTTLTVTLMPRSLTVGTL